MLGPKKMVDEWIVIRQLWNGATPSGRSKIKTNFQNSFIIVFLFEKCHKISNTSIKSF